MLTVEYHPSAVSDLNDAVDYYNQRRVGLGDELRTEVYAAIGRILARPRSYPVVESNDLSHRIRMISPPVWSSKLFVLLRVQTLVCSSLVRHKLKLEL